MVQTGVTTETLAEIVEQSQKTLTTTLEVVPEPELTGTGSEMLGNSAVRLVKIMEKKWAESEGIDGVTGVLRKAREEIILHENHDSLFLMYKSWSGGNREVGGADSRWR
jgi:hypothetical protein